MVTDVAIGQPVLFAMEVALAALWQSWGVRPDVVVGHSIGEAAAAYLAGVLDLAEAAHVVVAYSRGLKQATGTGNLALTELSPEQAHRIAQVYAGRLFYAGSNGPGMVLLSGETAAMTEIGAALERRQVFFGRVQLDAAVHSPLVRNLAEKLKEDLHDLQPKRATLPLYSSVTGERQQAGDYGPTYWARNMQAPIRFAEAIQQMLCGGPTFFVEVGPHPVLLPSVERAIRHYAPEAPAAFQTFASSRRGADEQSVMRHTLRRLQKHGLP